MWSAFPESSRQGQVTRPAGKAAPRGPLWRNTRLLPHRPWHLAGASPGGQGFPSAPLESSAHPASGQRRVRMGSSLPVLSLPGAQAPQLPSPTPSRMGPCPCRAGGSEGSDVSAYIGQDSDNRPSLNPTSFTCERAIHLWPSPSMMLEKSFRRLASPATFHQPS